MKKVSWIVLLAVGVAFSGCDCSEAQDGEAAQQQEGEALEQRQDDEAQVDDEATLDLDDSAREDDSSRESSLREPHDPSKPVEPDDFQQTMVGSVCLAFDECKNEELQAMVFSVLAMDNMVHAQQAGDMQRAQKLQQEVQQLQSSGQFNPDDVACDDLVYGTLSSQNLDADTIEASIDAEITTYDADQAGECMARFGESFELCEQEREMTADTDPQQMMMRMSAHLQDLESHFRACEGIFEGSLEEGEECQSSFECAELDCRKQPGEDTGECADIQVGPQGGGPGMGGPAGGGQPAPGQQPPGGPAPGGIPGQ